MRHSRRWKIFDNGGALLRAAGIFGVLIPALGAAEKVSGTLSVRDVLATPGQPVMLEARLVRPGLLNQAPLGGEQIEFIVAGKPVGTAMTGGDGRALLEYTPQMRGDLAVTVRLAQDLRVQSGEATGTLFCWERRRPILLVEFRALLDESPATLPIPSLPPITGTRPAAALPDAAEELKRLTDFFFNVVYISRSTGPDLDGTDLRDWLKRQRFPVGLLLAIGPDKAALEKKIDELRAEGWENLKAGIGATKEFAEVLVEHRIKVVIVPEPSRGDLPRKARAVKTWKDVRKQLQG